MIEPRKLSNKFVLIATLLFASVALGCGSQGSLAAPSAISGPSPSVAMSTINGRVTESAQTTGIAHATVYVEDGKLLGSITEIDGQGFYSILGLKTGRVMIKVLADHYKSVSEPLAVTGDTTVNFQLTPMAEGK